MRTVSISMLICLISLASSAAQSTAQSEQERNKAVARSFFENVLDQGHLNEYSDSHAANFVAHGGGRDYSLAEDMAAAREERQALPDMRVIVNQLVAERDLVAVYWTAAGTNTHEGMGFPATGKKLTVPGMTLFRFQAGKITEEWSVYDMLGAMRQAGLLPAGR
ncbi:MAG: ester cyclase [Terriglobales bacterium]